MNKFKILKLSWFKRAVHITLSLSLSPGLSVIHFFSHLILAIIYIMQCLHKWFLSVFLTVIVRISNEHFDRFLHVFSTHRTHTKLCGAVMTATKMAARIEHHPRLPLQTDLTQTLLLQPIVVFTQRLNAGFCNIIKVIKVLRGG